MANNYMQCSNKIVCSPEAANALKLLINFANKWDASNTGFDCELIENGICIYAEESGCPEVLEALIPEWQTAFNVAPFFLSFVYTCDKMRPDEFGGFTVVYHAGIVTEFNPVRDAMKFIAEKKKNG